MKEHNFTHAVQVQYIQIKYLSNENVVRGSGLLLIYFDYWCVFI